MMKKTLEEVSAELSQERLGKHDEQAAANRLIKENLAELAGQVESWCATHKVSLAALVEGGKNISLSKAGRKLSIEAIETDRYKLTRLGPRVAEPQNMGLFSEEEMQRELIKFLEE